MTALKHDMKRVQELTFEAYKASGGVMALIDGQDPDPGRLSSALDDLSARLEGGALELRALCETHQPRLRERPGKPSLPALDLTGSAEVNEYGWLHIVLNTLLPNCRFRTPAWLTDTVVRLLDRCEHRYGTLPMFDRALLVIDEHCDLDSRQVFDQDNKAWKAIPNALKGRLIRDDDQFTLGGVPPLHPKPGGLLPYPPPASAGRGRLLFPPWGGLPLSLTFRHNGVQNRRPLGLQRPAKEPAFIPARGFGYRRGHVTLLRSLPGQ